MNDLSNHTSRKGVIIMGFFTRIIQEYSRAKEDRTNEQIFKADPKRSIEIAQLIDDTLGKHRTVWLMTDWHYLKYNRDTQMVFKRPGADRIIKNCKNLIKRDDVLIFLGDICDGEVEKKNEIAEFLSQIPGIKIMIRGNNDLFPDQWYLDHGFDRIVPKFVWKNILFSHRPQDNQMEYNIHGHIHGSHKYYKSEVSHYHNQVDVGYFGGREKPLELNWLIQQAPKYMRSAKFVNHPWKNDPEVHNENIGGSSE